MSLTNKAAGCIITGLTGLILTFTNPNFEFRDIKYPLSSLNKKYHSNLGYEGSGVVYTIGNALLGGSIFGLGYLALTNNFRKKKR